MASVHMAPYNNRASGNDVYISDAAMNVVEMVTPTEPLVLYKQKRKRDKKETGFSQKKI